MSAGQPVLPLRTMGEEVHPTGVAPKEFAPATEWICAPNLLAVPGSTTST
jgi:hypothetical protein